MSIERIKTPMAKTLGTKFIEIYGQYAENGYSREIIIHKTMYKLQEIVIKYMIERPHDINIIAAALETIKHDTTLHEKALIAFDLSKCDENIRAKYMPLVMV
jgi:hypothetical protein